MRILIIAGKKRISLFNRILNKTIIDYYMEKLADFDVHISVCSKNEQLLKGYKDITLEVVDYPKGNAISVKKFADKYKEDFLCIYDDLFTTFNFKMFIDKLRKSDYVGTMVSKNIGKPRAFGIITFDNGKNVLSLTRSRYVNCGIYYFKPEISNYIDDTKRQDLDNDVLPVLIKESKLEVFTFNGVWFDVGNKGKLFNTDKKITERING